MRHFGFKLLLIILVIFMTHAVLTCSDDDDDSNDDDDEYTSYDDDTDDDWDSDDDDDDDDWDDDLDDDLDDDSYLGNCESPNVYDAISFLFDDCYYLENNQGYVMDADDVCLTVGSDQIDCFVDCYDAYDQCGGDTDPLYDCVVDCLDGGIDDDDDDDDDDFSIGNCETMDEYDAICWLFEDCYVIEDGEGNIMDADEICEYANRNDIECFLACYDSYDQCGGDDDPLFDCVSACMS